MRARKHGEGFRQLVTPRGNIVNQPAQTIASHDLSIGRTGFDVRRRGLRWAESQSSVRTMAIVVMYEDGDRSFKMLAIQDEQPVKTFISDGSYQTLGDGIRLRCSKRRAHDLDPFCSKHLVETRHEFLIAVPDQESDGLRPIGECPRQLPSLLRDPRRRRRRRATGQADAAAAQFDKEEDIKPL